MLVSPEEMTATVCLRMISCGGKMWPFKLGQEEMSEVKKK